ncbi:MAG: hypothetical protein U0531_17005 [Dehalococcoidia bacterium]
MVQFEQVDLVQRCSTVSNCPALVLRGTVASSLARDNGVGDGRAPAHGASSRLPADHQLLVEQRRRFGDAFDIWRDGLDGGDRRRAAEERRSRGPRESGLPQADGHHDGRGWGRGPAQLGCAPQQEQGVYCRVV